ncbi:YjbF family lipoprotein [Sulfitobacter sp. JB4-11]|uniref:YjbF family lipoprotein n=1 Tax=Sulfitobacter rhodophyticola TaxID=3238304 RepID=UPI0035146FBB
MTALALICVSLGLAGCNGGTGEQPDDALTRVGKAAVSVYQSWNQPEPQPVVVTRALLDQTPGQVMQAIPDNTGLQDFLRLVARRTDDGPGTIEVWQSSDNAQIILRDGVLVGTRGLGGDMRSAQAGSTLAGFDGQGGGGARLMTLARANGIAQTVEFACDMTQLGPETIQIVDQRVATYRMRETCVRGDVSFTNEYWVETSGGRMRKSRQWAGPVFGYIALERLKN